MQIINGTQFLNIIFLLALLAAVPASKVSAIVIVPLTSTYESLYIHKLSLIFEVLNLISLSSLYVPRDSSLISSHFFGFKFRWLI